MCTFVFSLNCGQPIKIREDIPGVANRFLVGLNGAGVLLDYFCSWDGTKCNFWRQIQDHLKSFGKCCPLFIYDLSNWVDWLGWSIAFVLILIAIKNPNDRWRQRLKIYSIELHMLSMSNLLDIFIFQLISSLKLWSTLIGSLVTWNITIKLAFI